MKQEGFLVGAFERVDELFIVTRAKRRNNESLRFTTREQR